MTTSGTTLPIETISFEQLRASTRSTKQVLREQFYNYCRSCTTTGAQLTTWLQRIPKSLLSEADLKLGLQAAALENNLQILQTLKTLIPNIRLSYLMEPSILKFMVERRNDACLKWLCTHPDAVYPSIDDGELFNELLYQDHLHVVQRLCIIQPHWTSKLDQVSLNIAARMGNVNSVRWLLQTVKTIQPSYNRSEALSIALHEGHNTVVQFFLTQQVPERASVGDFTHSELSDLISYLFENQQEPLLELLHKYEATEREDALATFNYLTIREAIKIEHLNFIHWLLHFKPFISLRHNNFEFFTLASTIGSVAIFQYLHNACIEWSDEPLRIQSAFEDICSHGYADLAAWLWDKFPTLVLSLEQVRRYLKTALVMNHSSFVKFLESSQKEYASVHTPEFLEECQQVCVRKFQYSVSNNSVSEADYYWKQVHNFGAPALKIPILTDYELELIFENAFEELLYWVGSTCASECQALILPKLEYYFLKAVISGSVFTVQWFLNRFVSGPHTTPASIQKAFNLACEYAYVNIVELLYTHFSNISLTCNNHKCFIEACENGEDALAAWFVSVHPSYQVCLDPEGQELQYSITDCIEVANEKTECSHPITTCPICLTEPANIETSCQHNFCYDCLNQCFQKTLREKCPLCRQPIHSYTKIISP